MPQYRAVMDKNGERVRGTLMVHSVDSRHVRASFFTGRDPASWKKLDIFTKSGWNRERSRRSRLREKGIVWMRRKPFAE